MAAMGSGCAVIVIYVKPKPWIITRRRLDIHCLLSPRVTLFLHVRSAITILASVDNKYHPYYDPQLPDGWLRARLIWDGSDEPPGIRYYTTRSAIGDKRLRSRVRDTFYGGSIAARWIVEFNQSLRALYRDFYDISNIDERKQIVEDTYSRRLHVYPGPMVATKHAVIASRWLRKWRTA